MRRRDFIRLAAGSAIAWPTGMAAQPAMPMIAFIRDGSAEGNARNTTGFRKGLNEGGFVEGQNITVEYHWLEGKYDRLPALLADVIRREPTVIVTPGQVPTRAAKAATSSVPIVFGVGENPVELGLVSSFSKPGGNATGINFLTGEMVPKRLRLLHDMVPKATRIAVLVNPGNLSVAESTAREVQEAASNMGLQTQVLNATSISEIDAAFVALARDRLEALFVAPDALFISRRVQLVTLTARDKVPAIYATRDPVVAGGLMSYGVDLTEMFRLMGVYTASILKGSRPGDLPVLQATKFEFIINLTTARALALTIPAGLVSIADEVIE
jgi:putative tryptophan/tyrosine transport system substrate-binding protein